MCRSKQSWKLRHKLECFEPHETKLTLKKRTKAIMKMFAELSVFAELKVLQQHLYGDLRAPFAEWF